MEKGGGPPPPGGVPRKGTAADGLKDVTTPLSDADVESLKTGDRVRISG